MTRFWYNQLSCDQIWVQEFWLALGLVKYFNDVVNIGFGGEMKNGLRLSYQKSVVCDLTGIFVVVFLFFI